MNKTQKTYVELTAVWGNADADSTIKISRRRWQAIRAGAEYSTSTWSWYEGKRESVLWSFADGEVTINGQDGMQCVVGLPVDNLIVSEPDQEERPSSELEGPRVLLTGVVPAENHDPYGFREGFRNAPVEELVRLFNADVGSRGWVRARGEFHFALQEAFLATGLDCSSFIDEDEGSISLARRIRLEGDRLVTVRDS